MNVPVSEDMERAPLLSFSETLKAVAAPADFVALKGLLDPAHPIVTAMVENPEVRTRVDEIYLGFTGGDIDFELERLTVMRRKGIRSHFWLNNQGQ